MVTTNYDLSQAKVGDRVWMEGWWGVIASIDYPDDPKAPGRARIEPAFPFSGYNVRVEAETVGGYSVSVAELPGCFAQGETKEAALKEIEVAIEAWRLAAAESGYPIPAVQGSDTVTYVDVP